MSARSRILSVTCALLVLLAVVVSETTENALLGDFCYLGVMIAASVVAWAGVARWPRGRRLMPCLIAAGISATALGDLVWTLLDRAGAETDASIADVGWFASYVFLCAALWMVLSRSRKDGRADLDFVVDAVTIVAISVLVFWTLSVEAIVDDTTVSPFVRVVWASYPVLDAVLVALVLRVLLSRRARAAIDVWFAVGACLWLTADLLYLHVPDNTNAVHFMDAAWMVAPVLIARAAWRVPSDRPVTPRESQVTAGWFVQLLLAVFPLAVPPVLELIADVRGQEDRPMQLLVGMVVVMALALVRTGRLILSEQRAQRELEVARDAALAASEAKSMFMANVSHELRTPLTVVLATGGLLTETPLNDSQRMLLGKLQRSGVQLQSLVEGLLDFSRLEAGRAVLERVELDLHGLVTDVVDAHLPRAREKGVGLDLEIDPRLPQHVIGDRTKVFQVLNNLVENALKFTADGLVRVSASPDAGEHGPEVRFTVTDTGIGIRAEDQASIFESFRQVDGSSSRRYSGTGLGLAICKDLAELMGGTVTVVSELGVGSTFTVRLPLTAATNIAPAPETPGVAVRA